MQTLKEKHFVFSLNADTVGCDDREALHDGKLAGAQVLHRECLGEHLTSGSCLAELLTPLRAKLQNGGLLKITFGALVTLTSGACPARRWWPKMRVMLTVFCSETTVLLTEEVESCESNGEVNWVLHLFTNIMINFRSVNLNLACHTFHVYDIPY